MKYKTCRSCDSNRSNRRCSDCSDMKSNWKCSKKPLTLEQLVDRLLNWKGVVTESGHEYSKFDVVGALTEYRAGVKFYNIQEADDE